MQHPQAPPVLTQAIPSPMALLRGFPLRQKAIFFRQLSTMIASALPLDASVQTAAIMASPALGREMAKLLTAGHPLSKVMGRYPHFFTDYEISIVAAGEYGGSLDTQLELLAGELERSYHLKQMVSSKLAYPILVAHAAIFIPTIPLFVTGGPAVYLRTTLSILIPVYLALFLAWSLFRLSAQASIFRQLTDNLSLWIPGLAGAVKTLACARFLRTLAHMCEAGISPDKSLQVAAQTCGNAYVASRVLSAARAVGPGERPSLTLIRAGVFPPMVTSMVASGEEAGSVGRIMEKASNYLEQELQARIATMMTVFPVLMMLGLGAVVGYIVISHFQSLAKMLNL